MKSKFKILLFIMFLCLSLKTITTTYSRYVAGTNGKVDASFAKWQLLINNSDITNNTSSEIKITPTIEENENVAKDKLAPSSTGYFDILIDPSNVDVSFDYTVSLDIDNENMPDIMVTKYNIIEDGSTDDLEYLNISNDKQITGTLNYDNDTNNFSFKQFTIRIYFEWYDGDDEEMSDSDDTNLITENEDAPFTINANITFNQKL